MQLFAYFKSLNFNMEFPLVFGCIYIAMKISMIFIIVIETGLINANHVLGFDYNLVGKQHWALEDIWVKWTIFERMIILSNDFNNTFSWNWLVRKKIIQLQQFFFDGVKKWILREKIDLQRIWEDAFFRYKTLILFFKNSEKLILRAKKCT